MVLTTAALAASAQGPSGRVITVRNAQGWTTLLFGCCDKDIFVLSY